MASHFLHAALWLGLLVSCTKPPKQHFDLTSLKVVGNDEIDEDEIEERIASRETPRFLGLFPGIIYDYETFNRFVLERDLQRIERFYRSRGYYQARVRAARVFRSGSKVKVEIHVDEGPPVRLARVDVHGLAGLPPDVQREAREYVASKLPLDEPFDEQKFEEAAEALAEALANHGYAQAKVRKAANVNLPRKLAAAGFWVEAGAASEIGEIRIEGLGDLPESLVRRALALQPGDEYSQADIDEARRALLELGVFNSVSIEPESEKTRAGPRGKPRVPLVVRVERAKLRAVRLGGGVQIDALRSDVHLTLGWEDQSFLGGMRRFQIEARPGAVIYPTRLPTFQKPERLLPQGRLRIDFRQPGFLEARSNALIKGELSVYPSLLSTDYDPEAPILGYREYRISAGMERTYFKTYGMLTHNLQISVPFAYVGNKIEQLKSVVVSYPALLAVLDLRNDRIKTHSGLYASTEIQVAGAGGDARDIKLRPEVRGYVPLSRRITLAAKGAIGLLFPDNYGDTVEENARTGAPGTSGPEGLADWVRDTQIMLFRGLFAGGPASNRGYAVREIGPHGTVPQYSRSVTSAMALPGPGQPVLVPECSSPNAEGYTKSACDLPLGGFTLWEASVELRYPLAGALSGTVFTDAADVAPERLTFRFDRPHLSAGTGLRYETPVGPIRFDIGYRLPGLQAPRNAPGEADPAELLGLPLAISLGIGETF